MGFLGLQATQADGKTVDPVIVDDLAIPSPLVNAPPQISPLDAPFENELSLLGYTLTYTSTAPGSRVQLDLYWKAASRLPDSYHVFVHWFDAQGQLIAQGDDIPCDGAYPTSTWGANEIVDDRHELIVAAGAAVGGSRFPSACTNFHPGNDCLPLAPWQRTIRSSSRALTSHVNGNCARVIDHRPDLIFSNNKPSSEEACGVSNWQPCGWGGNHNGSHTQCARLFVETVDSRRSTSSDPRLASVR